MEYIIGVCDISFPLLFERILERRLLLMRSWNESGAGKEEPNKKDSTENVFRPVFIFFVFRFFGAKRAMAFSGTQQKCKACDKTVYLVEQLTADGVIYHKSCFRCNHCKGTLKVSLLVSVSASLFWYYFFLPLPCSFRVEKGSKPEWWRSCCIVSILLPVVNIVFGVMQYVQRAGSDASSYGWEKGGDYLPVDQEGLSFSPGTRFFSASE